MKAKELMTLQFASLFTMICLADGFLEETVATGLFCSAFFIFAGCSIYISRHEEELIETNNEPEEPA